MLLNRPSKKAETAANAQRLRKIADHEAFTIINREQIGDFQ